jgi:transposase-like protein
VTDERDDNEEVSQTDEELARELIKEAREKGVSLTGPGGLLGRLTKKVLEAALDAEMTEHLGYERHAAEGRDGGNSRNGIRTKTVLTDVGDVDIDVPRDRDGSFEPQIVRKRQRRLGGVDELVISLSARGLTHGEITAHLAEVYDVEVSKDTISRITERVLEELADWQNRPLDAVYPVLFIDAIVVKVRDGSVANRPVYTALAVNCDGERDILGLWMGDGGEGAKFWHQVLGEIRRRGVNDVCIVCCDGLKGLPESISDTWPAAVIQTCVLHLIRNTFRYVSRGDWERFAKDLRPVYTAVNEAEARERFDELTAKWGTKFPAVIKLWNNAWAEFVPFLAYDPEIRRVIYSTNAIESIHARFRRAVRARGHFPTEDTALKCIYLTVRALDPTGKGRQRWATRWKPALNAFAITFEGRINPSAD